MICIPINLIGILYIIFVLKEVKHRKEGENSAGHETNGVENPAFESVAPAAPRPSTSHGAPHHQHAHKPCLVDFFNPVVAINCFQVIVRERPHNARRVVILLLVLYFIALGPAFGNNLYTLK